MKIVISTNKPRNPLVSPAHRRHAGRHQPSGGAFRQAARRQLHQELQQIAHRNHSP